MGTAWAQHPWHSPLHPWGMLGCSSPIPAALPGSQEHPTQGKTKLKASLAMPAARTTPALAVQEMGKQLPCLQI